MTKLTHKQVRAAAQVTRAAILEQLQANGPMDRNAIAAAIGLAPEATSRHLNALVAMKNIAYPVKGSRGGAAPYTFLTLNSTPCEYVQLGPDCTKARRKIVQQYPPNKVVDPYALDASFFGKGQQ